MRHEFRRIALVLGTTLTFALGLAAVPARAHDDDLGQGGGRGGSRDGAWRLVEPALGPGIEEFKVVAGGKFIWYVVDHGRITGGGEGRASVHGGTYVERIDATQNDDLAWMVGGEGRFDILAAPHGRWRHRGIVVHGEQRALVDEIWERVR